EAQRLLCLSRYEAAHRIEIDLDRHEEVAEIMSETAGDFADRVELLGPDQLFLGRVTSFRFRGELAHRDTRALHVPCGDQRDCGQRKGGEPEDAAIEEQMPVPYAENRVKAKAVDHIRVKRIDAPV